MIAKEVERELSRHVSGAGFITRRELKTFLSCDGKIGNDSIVPITRGVSYIRIGKGGTQHFFVKEIAKRLAELSE